MIISHGKTWNAHYCGYVSKIPPKNACNIKFSNKEDAERCMRRHLITDQECRASDRLKRSKAA